jgi:hypothetical protein
MQAEENLQQKEFDKSLRDPVLHRKSCQTDDTTGKTVLQAAMRSVFA